MMLLIVRHGETDGNVKGLCQIPARSSLTPLGKKQTERLAELLGGERIDAVYCSPYKRTKQTLAIIRKRVRAPVFMDARLREREMGEWVGKPVDDFIAFRESRGARVHEFRPEGGEDFSDVLQRAKGFWSDIRDKHAGRTVLLVAHGDFNRILISHLLGRSLEESSSIPQANCCLNEITVHGGKAEAVKINYTAFLDGLVSRSADSSE